VLLPFLATLKHLQVILSFLITKVYEVSRARFNDILIKLSAHLRFLEFFFFFNLEITVLFGRLDDLLDLPQPLSKGIRVLCSNFVEGNLRLQ